MGPKHHGRRRWYVKQDRLRLAVRGLAERMAPACMAKIAAAVETRIGVGDLAPAAGARHADAVAVAGNRRHVADDEDRRLAGLAEAQEGEDRIGAVIADQPAEARRESVALMA